jgi:hypothetical protein
MTQGHPMLPQRLVGRDLADRIQTYHQAAMSATAGIGQAGADT